MLSVLSRLKIDIYPSLYCVIDLLSVPYRPRVMDAGMSNALVWACVRGVFVRAYVRASVGILVDGQTVPARYSMVAEKVHRHTALKCEAATVGCEAAVAGCTQRVIPSPFRILPSPLCRFVLRVLRWAFSATVLRVTAAWRWSLSATVLASFVSTEQSAVTRPA